MNLAPLTGRRVGERTHLAAGAARRGPQSPVASPQSSRRSARAGLGNAPTSQQARLAEVHSLQSPVPSPRAARLGPGWGTHPPRSRRGSPRSPVSPVPSPRAARLGPGWGTHPPRSRRGSPRSPVSSRQSPRSQSSRRSARAGLGNAPTSQQARLAEVPSLQSPVTSPRAARLGPGWGTHPPRSRRCSPRSTVSSDAPLGSGRVGERTHLAAGAARRGPQSPVASPQSSRQPGRAIGSHGSPVHAASLSRSKTASNNSVLVSGERTGDWRLGTGDLAFAIRVPWPRELPKNGKAAPDSCAPLACDALPWLRVRNRLRSVEVHYGPGSAIRLWVGRPVWRAPALPAEG